MVNKLHEDMEKYLKYFRKKSNLTDNNLEEVNKILTSDKYSEFIESVYNYFNQRNNSNESEGGRLAIQCYLEADEIITNFWDQLLGDNMSEQFKTHLKAKLNM